MVSFLDIFKNKFLEMSDFADLSWTAVAQTLAIAFVVGLFVFILYKTCYRGVLYSHTFNISLALMTITTAMIITTIISNVVLSLGMVGALSIVRFLSAIKDPMDLFFLFWAVAEGIAVGARVYSVVVIGTLMIGLSLFILTRFKKRKMAHLLVINYQEPAWPEIQAVLSRTKYTLRSRMTKKENTELTVEIYLKDNNTHFVTALSEIPEVNNVALISYNGDFAQ